MNEFYRLLGSSPAAALVSNGSKQQQQSDPKGLFTLSDARESASRFGFIEVAHNSISRVASFEKFDTGGGGGGGGGGGRTKINAYYTTGTVATAISHPSHGKTQLFRRNVSKVLLATIFENPRTHTGKGYYRNTPQHDSISITGKRACPSNEGGIEIFDILNSLMPEEESLAAYIAEQKAELEAVVAWHATLKSERLAKEAAEKAVREEEERRRRLVAEEEERRRRVEVEEEATRKRGKRATYSLRDAILSGVKDSSYETDSCIALGCSMLGTGSYFRITDTNSWAYSGSIPAGLHQLFHTRSLHHPRPIYCQLSCDGGYWFVKFDNGAAKMNVPASFSQDYNEKISEGCSLAFCAFGDPGSYFMKFTNGSYRLCGLGSRHESKIRAATDITALSLGPQNQMFIRTSGGALGWVDGPYEAMNNANALKSKGWDVRQVYFGGSDGTEYIIRYS